MYRQAGAVGAVISTRYAKGTGKPLSTLANENFMRRISGIVVQETTKFYNLIDVQPYFPYLIA